VGPFVPLEATEEGRAASRRANCLLLAGGRRRDRGEMKPREHRKRGNGLEIVLVGLNIDSHIRN